MKKEITVFFVDLFVTVIRRPSLADLLPQPRYSITVTAVARHIYIDLSIKKSTVVVVQGGLRCSEHVWKQLYDNESKAARGEAGRS